MCLQPVACRHPLSVGVHNVDSSLDVDVALTPVIHSREVTDKLRGRKS